MKIFGLLLVFCLQTHLSFSQFEKGKAAVGFNLGFSYDKEVYEAGYGYKSSSIGSNIEGEFFLHRNLSAVIGLGVDNYNRLSTHSLQDTSNKINSYEETTKYNSISTIAGIRKYWFTNEGKFGLFVMPYVVVAFTKQQVKEEVTNSSTQYITYDRTENYWSPYFKTDLGFCYFVKPNFSIELSANIFEAAYFDETDHYIYLLRDLRGLRYGIRYYF